MNNLNAIMEERSMSNQRLSIISGINVHTIARLRRDDNITRAFRYTIEALASALAVTPAVLKGDIPYEYGNTYLLYKRIHDTELKLAEYLREFSETPLSLTINIMTKDEKSDENTDFISFNVSNSEELINKESARVTRNEKDVIIGIMPYYREIQK